MKRMLMALFVAVTLAAGVSADTSDSWITTKAKLQLMTSDGIHVSAPNVDTVDGKVTLHGKVETAAEKTQAEAIVKKIDGVKSVNNLLQVVSEKDKKSVDASDSVIKDQVQASLKKNASLKDVEVASVNKGVVLLSGKAAGLAEKLRAVEAAYQVDGVRRVATEIEAPEN
jgi:hyperosmotically inducible periplasmic protein